MGARPAVPDPAGAARAGRHAAAARLSQPSGARGGAGLRAHPTRSCRACTRPIGRSSPISAPTLSCRRCCICCPSIWPAASLWACSILLPVVGTIAYSRAVFGVYSAWPLASGLVAYNATLLLGFLNFVAAIGIALLLAAGWIAWRERHPARTVALATIGAVALFFCHLMGLLFFFVLIAGHEFEQLWLRRTHWAAIPARLAALAPLFVVSLGLYLVSPLAPLVDRNRILSPDRQGEATGPSVCQLHPAARHRHGVHGRHISPRLSRKAPLPRLAGQRRGSVADGPALSGRTLGVQGNLLSRHTIRDHVGVPAVRRIAAQPVCRASAALSAATAFTLLFGIRMAVVAFAWHGARP